MARQRLAVVVPSYNAFSYVEKAIRSAYKNTKALRPHVFLLDDCSRDWDPAWIARVLQEFPGLEYVVFPAHGGLIRSWNAGLRWARIRGYEYACLANSDLVFPAGWDREIVAALELYDLAGPLTNAPGTERAQYVGPHSSNYRRDRLEENCNVVQTEVWHRNHGRLQESPLNGFCLVAKTAAWWNNAFDPQHVFSPKNLTSSSGRPNPDPLSCLGEYEYQRRLRSQGGRAAIALGSYVAHFRSCSRPGHEQGDWVRLS